MVFSTAIIRFYLIGMLELNTFVNSITGAFGYTEAIISIFSFLVFGQIIDN
jgi:hypothetical protein